MNKKGGLHLHRGVIALTGIFVAAVALSACGNEKMSEQQTGHETSSDGQTKVSLQKKERDPSGAPLVAPVSPQAMKNEKTSIIQPAQFDSFIIQSKLLPFRDTVTGLQSEPTFKSYSFKSYPFEPYMTRCGESDIVTPLHEVVTALEEKTLLYGIQPLTDCSGIFHRVLMGLEHRCPGQDFPSVTKYRDSRALARWYYERGKLTLIENVMESTDLLKPGAVLFFGRNGSVHKDFSFEDLLAPRRGIDHLGVVVKVHKNKSGEVLRYELFHGYGKRGKTAASITNWHRRTPTRASYPPFGNGRQQWVAAARI
ncbi:MAG: hypothetical protein D3924_02930 [Candidatus Electrothrix sp. AR4]|nr:hypothetical protein [Candidatus Electrothrix sp. AR4]